MIGIVGEEPDFSLLQKEVKNSSFPELTLLEFHYCLVALCRYEEEKWGKIKNSLLIHYHYQLAAIFRIKPTIDIGIGLRIPTRVKIYHPDEFINDIACSYSKNIFGEQSLQYIAEWYYEHTEQPYSPRTVYNKLTNYK